MSNRRGPNIAPTRFEAASADSVAGLPGGGLLGKLLPNQGQATCALDSGFGTGGFAGQRLTLDTTAFQYRTMMLEVRGESHDRGQHPWQ